MKRILIYAHYFYPDVASTGQILTELAEGLQYKFDITVICVVPSYGGKIEDKYKTKRIYYEKYKNINVIRVRVPEFNKKIKISRIKNILVYFFNSIYATFKTGKQDLIFTISQPPILGGMLGAAGKIIKKAKLIYNIQDFNPEQAAAVGYINKYILKFAKLFDIHSCKKADEIVVVGRDMQRTLINRFRNKQVPPNIFINNWIDEKSIYPLSDDNDGIESFKKKYGLENKFIIMYSGNLGLYYDLENIIKCFKDFSNNNDIAFVFVGGGTVKNKLIEYKSSNKLNNIYFIPYQMRNNLIYSLNAADVHLVINAKGIKGISVPSKLYGVMACAKPVLGVLEKGSEARTIIEDADCGICVDTEDYNGLKSAIITMINEKEKMKLKGIGGRNYLDKYLKKEISIDKYNAVINKLL